MAQGDAVQFIVASSAVPSFQDRLLNVNQGECNVIIPGSS